MKSIIWLASYPKSGNTWLRMFLANYLLGTDQPVPLARMQQIAQGDSTLGAYRTLARHPVNPRNETEVLSLRFGVLSAIAGNGADINLVKTHNQNARARGVELIPASVTRMAIYVVRNPLDLLLSYAHHYGMSSQAAARAIGDTGNVVLPDATNVIQYLGSWSDHVTGWTRARSFPVCTLRYEDMIADPEAAFATALKRMGVPVDQDRLARAIGFSSFDQLRGQEEAHGFIEKSRHAERFFRAGTTGQWREALEPDIIASIRETHGKVMRRFGYLEE